MKSRKILCCLLLFFLSMAYLGPSTLWAESSKGYRVKEQGNNLELITPYGNKLIYGSFSLDGVKDYQIEIPLEQLRPESVLAPPKPTPEPEPEPTPPAPRRKYAEDTEYEEEDSPRPRKREEVVEAYIPRPTPNPTPTPTPTPTPKPEVEYDDSDRFVLEANRLYNRGKLHEASHVIEELLRRRPNHVRGWVMKGSINYILGHKDLAQKAWKTAQALEPGNREIKDILERYK